jgi:AraC-like DNA-binding protein
VITPHQEQLLQRLSPHVRKAWNHKVTQRFHIPRRAIFDYELLYLAKGILRVTIEDSPPQTLHPGTIVLFKPGKEHSFYTMSDGETVMPHIHFDVTHYDNYAEVPINLRPLAQCSVEERRYLRPDVLGDELGFPDVIQIPNHEQLHRRLLALIDVYERREPYSTLRLKALTLEILHLILDGLAERESPSFSRCRVPLEQGATYLLQHYDRKIDMQQLAHSLKMSPSHFDRMFKRRYQLTPMQFLIHRRIEKAKELMMHTSATLTTISLAVGYESIHAFSKVFRRNEGMSPSQFRNSIIYPGRSPNDLLGVQE